MPTYTYRCDACKHEFEQQQKITDEALKECPECHESKLKRLITNTSFILKGNGWYETDFKNKS